MIGELCLFLSAEPNPYVFSSRGLTAMISDVWSFCFIAKSTPCQVVGRNVYPHSHIQFHLIVFLHPHDLGILPGYL